MSFINITKVILLGLFLGFNLYHIQAQDEISARMNLYYSKTPDNVKHIDIKLTAKIDNRRTGVPGVNVLLYHTETLDSNLISNVIMDDTGVGRISFSDNDILSSDSSVTMKYIAVLKNQKGFKDVEKEIEIMDGFLDIEFEIKDSIRTAMVKFLKTGKDQIKVPMEGVPIKLYVKRPFGKLPIEMENNVTDKNGMVYTVFPDDLIGDTLNLLTVIARVEDHDDFGNLEAFKIIDWGLERPLNENLMTRSLWASGANAPIPLLIFVNALILAAWGIIFYILILIYRIYRTGIEKK